MHASLLDYAEDVRIPSPLPSLDLRNVGGQYRTPRGWPVGLLPAEAIANDLARRGVTYRNGNGWATNGRQTDAVVMGAALARLLDDVADRLQSDPRASVATALREFENAAFETQGQTMSDAYDDLEHSPLTDEEISDLGDTAGAFAGFHLVPILDAALRTMPSDLDEKLDAERIALRETALDLRRSPRTARMLLGLVRPYLPERPAEEACLRAAEQFLADEIDPGALVRRSEISTCYARAGSPGGLTSTALRTLAAHRYGPARRLGGHYVHRPTASAPAPLTPPVGPDGRPERPDPVDAAIEYAEGNLEHLGRVVPLSILRDAFDLTPEQTDTLGECLGRTV